MMVTMTTTKPLEVKSKFHSRKNVLWHIFYEITRLDLILHAFARDPLKPTIKEETPARSWVGGIHIYIDI